jgi:glycosyltransferase involved in cell wall biosynthesis
MRTAFLGCVRATRRTLREIRPDIVHGQGTESDCAMSAVFSGFPNVLTLHGNMRRIAEVEKHPYNWIAARLERLALPRSLGTICLTRHTERQVLSLAKRTWIVPNAVDPSFFEITAQPDPPRNRVLCVATICALKNQIRLIRSLDNLGKKCSFELIFLGGGEEVSPYCREFRRLVEARPWCRYEGFADRETLKRHLRTATLLVLPSLEENCPMVILEAMAAGVPVLAASVGGVPDLLEEGITGFFCDPQDEASISTGVEGALSNSARLKEIAKQAKRQSWERFHPVVIAKKHLDIYQEVLGGGGKQGDGRV